MLGTLDIPLRKFSDGLVQFQRMVSYLQTQVWWPLTQFIQHILPILVGSSTPGGHSRVSFFQLIFHVLSVPIG